MNTKISIDALEIARFDGKITGDNVKYIRKTLGLSQAKFADLLKYRKGGQGKISEIEAGKREMGEIQIELLYWFNIAAIYIKNNAKTAVNP